MFGISLYILYNNHKMLYTVVHCDFVDQNVYSSLLCKKGDASVICNRLSGLTQS